MTNKLGIKTSQVAIEVLASRIYSRPHEAVIRELLTNAWEVSRTPPRARIIQSFLVIEDDGPGMSEQELREHYCTFFSSSKNFDQIGGFGLGCKVPLAIAKSFTVHSDHATGSWLLTLNRDGTYDLRPAPRRRKTTGLHVMIPIYTFDKPTMKTLLKKYSRLMPFTIPDDWAKMADAPRDGISLWLRPLTDKELVTVDYSVSSVEVFATADTPSGNIIAHRYSADTGFTSNPFLKLARRWRQKLILVLPMNKLEPLPGRELLSAQSNEFVLDVVQKLSAPALDDDAMVQWRMSPLSLLQSLLLGAQGHLRVSTMAIGRLRDGKLYHDYMMNSTAVKNAMGHLPFQVTKILPSRKFPNPSGLKPLMRSGYILGVTDDLLDLIRQRDPDGRYFEIVRPEKRRRNRQTSPTWKRGMDLRLDLETGKFDFVDPMKNRPGEIVLSVRGPLSYDKGVERLNKCLAVLKQYPPTLQSIQALRLSKTQACSGSLSGALMDALPHVRVNIGDLEEIRKLWQAWTYIHGLSDPLQGLDDLERAHHPGGYPVSFSSLSLVKVPNEFVQFCNAVRGMGEDNARALLERLTA